MTFVGSNFSFFFWSQPVPDFHDGLGVGGTFGLDFLTAPGQDRLQLSHGAGPRWATAVAAFVILWDAMSVKDC